MKIYDGMEKEYEKRHDEIWPEMKTMIKENGISNYSIFWDKETNFLFSYMEVDEERSDNAMVENPLRTKWWAYMADIMETHPDNSPISLQLKNVFYLD